MKLIGILNTEHNMERYKADQMTREELEQKAAYKELPDDYRKACFSEVLNFLAKDDSEAAIEAKDYLQQHNGHNLICEVRVYDAECERKRNQENSGVFSLGEKVSPYFDTRQVKSTGESYDCLEMTVDLYSDVGR